MPMAPLAACLTPRCPGFAVARGYCAMHRRSEADRHYGAEWRKTRKARTGSACVLCGATRDLVLDHVVNGDPSRVQTLCRSCNSAKRNRERGATGMRTRCIE